MISDLFLPRLSEITFSQRAFIQGFQQDPSSPGLPMSLLCIQTPYRETSTTRASLAYCLTHHLAQVLTIDFGQSMLFFFFS